MDNIHIELSQDEVDCFLRHVSIGLPLRQKLSYSYFHSGFPNERPVEFSNTFECSEGDARALLRIALEYCPEAVQKIKNGLRLAGITNF